ncbi:hypothetical protein [Collimonas humicola]|nr:hypothetical protein [Collimonas humicola]
MIFKLKPLHTALQRRIQLHRRQMFPAAAAAQGTTTWAPEGAARKLLW